MTTVLLTGASGFIGSRLSAALARKGCRVVAVSHRAGQVVGDFTKDIFPGDWTPRLQGVDVVINAVGIIRELGQQTFRRLHTEAPIALFQACAAAGVRRIVQISALGAEGGNTAYFRSKREADEFLMTSSLDWCIARPALIYGLNGGSAQLFDMLASLPIIPTPGSGSQIIQPVHIDDVIAALVQLAIRRPSVRQIVPIVGGRALALRDFLLSLRRQMGLRSTVVVPVPIALMRVGAMAGDAVGSPILGRDTLTMLGAGNTGDAQPLAELLGRPPRDVDDFIEPHAANVVRTAAQARWLLPLLRFSIAIVWLWTGAVSAGLYPVESSYELLARTGLTGLPATIALYGAALLDFALGIATLAWRERRLLWLIQIALILSYSAIILFRLPEFWLHPYGPLLKNVPMLAAIYLLYVLEKPRWSM
jgi:uncharacterized protein YbjT (DUF2867 family)